MPDSQAAADPWPQPEAAAAARRVACPFLRLETAGALGAPGDAARDDHRCVAIKGPRVISRQQQDLVCLRAAHLDCPRYRRGVIAPSEGHAARPASMPRPVVLSLVLLALAAGISFGFVVQRGGIDLPIAASASAGVGSASGAASASTAGSSAMAGGASAVATEAPTIAAPSPTSAVTSAPSPTATPTAAPTVAPTAAPTPRPTHAPTPQPTTPPTARPTAAASAGPSGSPSAERLALLKSCPGQPGCYLYTVRSGDNLYSIARYFGVPLDTVYSWNPALATTSIRPGMTIKIPTPTR